MTGQAEPSELAPACTGYDYEPSDTLCSAEKTTSQGPIGPALLNDSRAKCNCTNCPMKAHSVNTVLHNHVPITQAQ